MRTGRELRSDWSKSKFHQNPITQSATGCRRRSVGRGNAVRTHCRLEIEIQWELIFDPVADWGMGDWEIDGIWILTNQTEAQCPCACPPDL